MVYHELMMKGNQTFYIVFHIMKRANGNLYSIIEKPLEYKEKMKIIGDILNAIKYAHQMKICHLDLKPENILNFNGLINIADWGSAKRKFENTTVPVFNQSNSLTRLAMTIKYTPPEIRQRLPNLNLFKADVFAFGLICCMIMDGMEDDKF